MRKTVYNPPTLAAPVGHFARAVRLGDWLFVSGTSALTNVSGPMAERRLVEGIDAQTHETLDNIEKVLTAAGGSFECIYEMRIVLRDASSFPTVDQILQDRISGKAFIAHGYEGVLLHPDMELEIEVNAYLGPIER